MTRVLIAEDEQRVARLLQDGLEAAGYRTSVAPTGAEALAGVRSDDCDLLILDLGLPDRDGLDVLRELRAEGRRVPVLVLTARGEAGDRFPGLRGGAGDDAAAPFRFSALLARMRARLRPAQTPAEPLVRDRERLRAG